MGNQDSVEKNVLYRYENGNYIMNVDGEDVATAKLAVGMLAEFDAYMKANNGYGDIMGIFNAMYAANAGKIETNTDETRFSLIMPVTGDEFNAKFDTDPINSYKIFDLSSVTITDGSGVEIDDAPYLSNFFWAINEDVPEDIRRKYLTWFFNAAKSFDGNIAAIFTAAINGQASYVYDEKVAIRCNDIADVVEITMPPYAELKLNDKVIFQNDLASSRPFYDYWLENVLRLIFTPADVNKMSQHMENRKEYFENTDLTKFEAGTSEYIALQNQINEFFQLTPIDAFHAVKKMMHGLTANEKSTVFDMDEFHELAIKIYNDEEVKKILHE